MDIQKAQSPSKVKKEKKKKHQRSNQSSREHKKKKSSYSREKDGKKKDKDKKNKRSKSKSRSRDVKQDRDRPRNERNDRDRYDGRRDRQYEPQREKQKKKSSFSDNYRGGDRGDNRDRGGDNRYRREDKYANWRRQKQRDRPLFDSPPHSDESVMSDDPEKMDKLNRMKAAKQLVTSKADRKLYLGNLPPNITAPQLMEMLNSALKKMEINCQSEGDSIVSAWISPDGVGHYAFVQFRSALEASNGLTLNGASLYGYQLKLGRPKQYIEYNKQLLSELGTDGNIDTIMKKVAAMGGFDEEALKVEEKIVYPPSKVIVLKHIVTIEELAIDQEFNQILDDVTDMAKRYGDVSEVIIPRPHQVIDLEEVQKRVKGLGFVFIKYKTIAQARFARKQFIKQMFSERTVACSFFDEKRLTEKEYDFQQKVVIEF